jgi:hypothetical protein
MFLYYLLGLFAAIGAGFASFQAILNVYLAVAHATSIRDMVTETGYALFRLGYATVCGVLLYIVVISPAGSRVLHDTPISTSIISGLGAASLGIVLLTTSVIKRVVEMETKRDA